MILIGPLFFYSSILAQEFKISDINRTVDMLKDTSLKVLDDRLNDYGFKSIKVRTIGDEAGVPVRKLHYAPKDNTSINTIIEIVTIGETEFKFLSLTYKIFDYKVYHIFNAVLKDSDLKLKNTKSDSIGI